MQGGSSQCERCIHEAYISMGVVHIGDVIYERPLVISFIQRLRMPTPTSHYGNVFQNASRSQQARSAIAMSLVKHHDDACGMRSHVNHVMIIFVSRR